MLETLNKVVDSSQCGVKRDTLYLPDNLIKELADG